MLPAEAALHVTCSMTALESGETPQFKVRAQREGAGHPSKPRAARRARSTWERIQDLDRCPLAIGTRRAPGLSAGWKGYVVSPNPLVSPTSCLAGERMYDGGAMPVPVSSSNLVGSGSGKVSFPGPVPFFF